MPDQTQLDRIEGRLTRIEQKIDNVTALQRATLSEIFTMAANFDVLIQKVTNLETVNESAITLLGELAQLVRDLPADQSAINQLADRIDADRQRMADAVVANTPST